MNRFVRARKHIRGFTLLELVAGLAISAIVLGGVAASFIAVQASYTAETQVKGLTENARVGIDYVERTLRMAGYGLDPQMAFDFATVPAGVVISKDNDSSTGFVTDDLAFRFRDPSYLKRGSYDGAGTLTLEGGGVFEQQLAVGQAIIIACTGANTYLVVRTTALVLGADTSAAVADYGAPFGSTSHSCLQNTGNQASHVMLMREYRFRVTDIDGRPWLVAYRNLSQDVDDPNSDFDPIAIDVETFQVSYSMNRPRPTSACCATTLAVDHAGNGNWVLGDDTPLLLPNAAATPPTYDTEYDNVLRFNDHPANIRAVRVTIGLRSFQTDQSHGHAPSSAPSVIENYTPVSLTPDGYYRSRITTSVVMPNMLSRSFFVPALRPAGSTVDLNVWGG